MKRTATGAVCLLMLAVSCLAYSKLVDESSHIKSENKQKGKKLRTEEMVPFSFASFDSMKEAKYRKYKYGFPAGYYGSFLMPTFLWYMHAESDKASANFGAVVPVTIDWFHLVRSCDEILLPRCSWPHFLNLFQAIGQDNELMRYATFRDFDAESWTAPLTRHACYPIRSQDQISANYIYAVCTVYWNETGFERDICANPCHRKPCLSLPNTKGDYCNVLGIHEKDFECTCIEGYVWNSLVFACQPGSRCNQFCHQNNTASCDFDPVSGVVTCVCRGGYMGTTCSEELDACTVGSEVYDVTSMTPEEGTFGVDLARARIPPGFKACATTVNSANRCIPQLGTSSYYCRCTEGFAMDASLSYDNCLSETTPCASQICIEGTCVASKDGQNWICDCEDGYTGPYCDQKVGEWSTWSTWTLCDPYCGPRRQRKRQRVCLSENQTDCTGAVENVEFCQAGEPCPPASTMEWAEWEEFAEWTWTLNYYSLIYIGSLIMIFTVLIYLKPEFEDEVPPQKPQQQHEAATEAMVSVAAQPATTNATDIRMTDLVRREPGTSVPILVMSPLEHAQSLPGLPSPVGTPTNRSNSASPELRSLNMEDSYPLK